MMLIGWVGSSINGDNKPDSYCKQAGGTDLLCSGTNQIVGRIVKNAAGQSLTFDNTQKAWVDVATRKPYVEMLGPVKTNAAGEKVAFSKDQGAWVAPVKSVAPVFYVCNRA